jgi:hypothetical protein
MTDLQRTLKKIAKERANGLYTTSTSSSPMIRIAKNRILDALLKFILVTALIHLSVMAVYSIVTWDFGLWNYFRIINLNLFVPGSVLGPVSMAVSAALMATGIMAMYFFYTKGVGKKALKKGPGLAALADRRSARMKRNKDRDNNKDACE